MDTREKIVDLATAFAIASNLRSRGVRLKLVAGYFDVLMPKQVRRFRELAHGQVLMVALLDPPDPLLAPRARAELAAALGVVDYVLLLDGMEFEHAIEKLQPDEVIREEFADRQRSRALIEHVHRR